MLNIGGFTPCTTIDYPGELAAVIFCQGCPWRCGYCHNPYLQDTGRAGTIAWDDLCRFLAKRRGLLDAVVFSGGEPTMQVGLSKAAKMVREMGFKVGLHTAGPWPERVLACLPHLDWVGMDIKAPFEEYEAITGVPGSGAAARSSAELLRRSRISHQFRITLDPWLLEKGRIETVQQLVAGEWGEQLVVQQMTTREP